VVSLGLDVELVGQLLDDVAHPRHGGVDDQGATAAAAQRPDAQVDRTVARLERLGVVAVCLEARALDG